MILRTLSLYFILVAYSPNFLSDEPLLTYTNLFQVTYLFCASVFSPVKWEISVQHSAVFIIEGALLQCLEQSKCYVDVSYPNLLNKLYNTGHRAETAANKQPKIYNVRSDRCLRKNIAK